MSESHHWNEQEGMLWFERDGLRLVIHPPSANGYVRFACSIIAVQITIRTASSARGHSRTFRLQKTRPQEWQSAL